MTDLNQIRVAWTGAAGLPGVNTFYSTGSPSTLLARLKTFYEAIKSDIPNTITITFPSSGNVIDSASGVATASWAVTAPAPTVCTGSGTYQAPTGFVINWTTPDFVAGRRLRGKTFIVPVINGITGGDGKLVAATRSSLEGFANAVVGGTDPMVVYSKTHKVNGVVTAATIPSGIAVLRSRRD